MLSNTLPSTPASQSSPPVSEEENKQEFKTTHADQSSWVYYNAILESPLEFDDELAIHKELYESLGIIALITPYNPSTQIHAEQFITHNSIIVGNTTYRYGDRQQLALEMGWHHSIFSKSDTLLAQLQKIADVNSSPIDHPVYTEIQNTQGLFALTHSSPIPYQSLVLRNGTLSNGLSECISAKIYPSVSNRSTLYDGTPFSKFVFSHFLLGTDLIGKMQSPDFTGECAILTEAFNLPPDQMIQQVPPCASSFFEKLQMQSINQLIVMMKRLGKDKTKAICNLHTTDYILYAILLYLDQKISKSALDSFIEQVLIHKDITERNLLTFFYLRNIQLIFISSLDNLFVFNKPPGMPYSDYFLNQLDLASITPDSKRMNYLFLLKSLLSELGLNDLKLITLNSKTPLNAIDNNELKTARNEKRPILVKKEVRLANVQVFEFHLYGEKIDQHHHRIWCFTKLKSANVDDLHLLPFKDNILRRNDPLFTLRLINILKEGHLPYKLRHPEHGAVWNDFLRVVNVKDIELLSLKKLLDMADAVTIAIIAKNCLPNEVCSIENSSRRHIQDIESYYTKTSDMLQATPVTIEIDYPAIYQRRQKRNLPVNYSQPMPQPIKTHSNDHHYPSVFFISNFDLCLGSNLANTNNGNHTAFYLKETPHNMLLCLANHSILFKNASTNGAVKKDDPRHTPLRARMTHQGSS